MIVLLVPGLDEIIYAKVLLDTVRCHVLVRHPCFVEVLNTEHP